MNKYLVINGPNLNFLGIREPEIYGKATYKDLCELINNKAKELNVDVEIFQSNHEGVIIDKLHAARTAFDGVIINAGAYTHYSYAIHDALKSLEKPVKVEVHISDIQSREDFRKVSVTAPACDKQIYGKGLAGYTEAMDMIVEMIK